MAVIWSRSSRPLDRAQMCSTTSAWVNRAEWAHRPTSGSVSASVISSQPGASQVGVRKAHRPLQLGPDRQVDLARLLPPPAGQQARGQRVVLPGPGGQGCFVVCLHAKRRRFIQGAFGLQFRLDLGAALGERSQLRPAETSISRVL